jgi:hypothetical protein
MVRLRDPLPNRQTQAEAAILPRARLIGPVKGAKSSRRNAWGFLPTAAKKHGLKIESTKTEAGDRLYQIKGRDSGLRSD